MKYLVLDYETRSKADLKKTGAFEYANHPSTQILCAAWRFGTRAELRAQLTAKTPAKIWSPAFRNEFDDPLNLSDALADPEVTLIAHNAFFEQVITRFVLPRQLKGMSPFTREIIEELPHDRWLCTASLARALALPGNLEGACMAIRLPIQKDMDGRRLLMKYMKPRKPTKNNPAEFHSSARDLRRIMQYCQTDVDAETLLFLTLPELHPTERQVWLLDQCINMRGFKTDRETVKKVLRMIAEETAALNRETQTISPLTSTTQRDALLAWLESEGYFLPDLRAKTVSDSIAAGLVEGKAKRVLEIRQSISKTSTAKYVAFEQRSRTDGRVRDILIYHTASTGRWGGAGVQPQNFPRGTIPDTDTAADVLTLGDLEWVRSLYGNPMEVFSSCLRAMIVAPEGKELIGGDYAAIEARVLFWIAGHAHGVKSFREGVPMYEQMAQVIYSLSDIELVTKLQRQVGKQAFLGCGYGMGWRKFMATCWNFGIEVDEDTAQLAVRAYRDFHWPVVKAWSNIERAAIAAVQNPGKKFKINQTTWWIKDRFLWCELPSGRRLAYYGPEVKFEPTPWDEKRPVLYHFGINPLSRKWASSSTYGGRLVENVVQAIARDLMASAMLRIEAAGYPIILSVHDELLAECVIGNGSVDAFEKLMAEIPPWAEGCPVKVEGWSGLRYRK